MKKLFPVLFLCFWVSAGFADVFLMKDGKDVSSVVQDYIR